MSGTLTEAQKRAARNLAAARRENRADVEIDPGAVADLAAAEAVQWAAAEAMGEPLAGYKIGATSEEAQRIVGCSEPFYGQMFASSIHPSEAVLTAGPGALVIECEFAFRLAKPLPARDSPYSREEVTDAIEVCAPAIELVARRSAGEGFPPYLLCVADMGGNGAFVHGAPIADWRSADLAAMPVVAYVDGEETNRGSGAAVLGHPLAALAWLVNRLSGEGRGIEPGQWISTGTCLGVVPVRPGSTVRAEFGGKHVVEIGVSAG